MQLFGQVCFFLFRVYAMFCFFVFGCQCSRLPGTGRTRLQNGLLYVEWEIRPYTLTPKFLFYYREVSARISRTNPRSAEFAGAANLADLQVTKIAGLTTNMSVCTVKTNATIPQNKRTSFSLCRATKTCPSHR